MWTLLGVLREPRNVEKTRAPLVREGHLWSCQGEGESRKGNWWDGVQDNGCRIHISRGALCNLPDLQSDFT